MADEQENDNQQVTDVVSYVAKTGGIKLKQEPDKWYNPAPAIKDSVTPDLIGKVVVLTLQQGSANGFERFVVAEASPNDSQGMVVAQRNNATVKAAVKDGSYGKPTPVTSVSRAQAERERGTGLEIARKHGHIMNFRGNEYITYKGLLDIAHEKGLQKMDTKIEHIDFKTHTAVVKGTVYMRSGEEYSAMGDASPENVSNASIQPHFLRMAETRALARALRQATNVGMTSLEELEIGKPAELPDHKEAP